MGVRAAAAGRVAGQSQAGTSPLADGQPPSAKRRRGRRRRRRRLGVSAATTPLRATHPGHVWTYDFVYDACLSDAKLKLLPVVDEFTRECLAIEVATALPCASVIRVLARLFTAHGPPAYLRSDNGPEVVAHAIQGWLALQQAATLYIDPGCPWQNAVAESFNGRLRDECLNMQAFASVAEARIQIERFRRAYNEERPHSRLGYRTPAEFTADWLADQSQQSNTARS